MRLAIALLLHCACVFTANITDFLNLSEVDEDGQLQLVFSSSLDPSILSNTTDEKEIDRRVNMLESWTLDYINPNRQHSFIYHLTKGNNGTTLIDSPEIIEGLIGKPMSMVIQLLNANFDMEADEIIQRLEGPDEREPESTVLDDKEVHDEL